jgi:hypothetical protein
MNISLQTPEQTIEQLFVGMRESEIKVIREEMEEFPRSLFGNMDPLTYMSDRVTALFIRTCHHPHHGKSSPEGIEKIINRLSQPLCDLVNWVEFGTLGFYPMCMPRWDKLPKNLGKLRRLRYLYLNQQGITSIEALRPLKLNFLCLEECPVSDISPLNLQRLDWLNLRRTETMDIRPISQAPFITGLPMNETRITDTAFKIVEGLPMIRTCEMGDSKIRYFPDEIGNLSHKDCGFYTATGALAEKTITIHKNRYWWGTDYRDFID